MPELGGRMGRSSSRPACRAYWYIKPPASWNWGGVGRKSGWGKGTCRDFFPPYEWSICRSPKGTAKKVKFGEKLSITNKTACHKTTVLTIETGQSTLVFLPVSPAGPLYLHFFCEVQNLSWEAGHVTGYLLYTVLEARKGITLIPMLIFDKTHRELARSCLITVRGEDRLPSPLQLLMLTLCFSSA